MRANSTSAEDVLWQKLRARRLGGIKFIRQSPIATYFVDFLCREAKLIVEVDGGTHSADDELEADKVRTHELNQLGFQIMRVSNAEVFENIDGVCETLLARLNAGTAENNNES